MLRCVSNENTCVKEWAVLVSCQCAGLMMIESSSSVVERRCSMTMQILINILPGKPFNVYIANMMAKPLNLQNIMILTSAWNAQHASYTQEMMTCTCWKMRAGVWCNVTEIIPILLLMLFAISCPGAVKSKWVVIMQWENLTAFRRSTGAMVYLYPTNILLFVKNL